MSRSALRNRATTAAARADSLEPEEPGASAERPPWWRRHALVLHVAILVGLVLAIAPLTLSAGVGWIDDEGAYALQVEALLDGTWDYGYWGADFDPEGRWQPISRAAVDGEHTYPYVKHPVYAVLLAGGAWLFGTGFGLYAVPMLGLVLAAVVSWLLAEEFEPRAGPVAFWLVAGSPLLIDAYVLYAHTLGAAVAGAGLLFGVRVIRHGLTWTRLAGLAAALFLGALLRSEAILFGAALIAAMVGALAWRTHRARLEWERTVRRGSKRRKRQALTEMPETGTARTALWLGGVGVAAIAAAVALERVFVGWIVGTSSAASSLASRGTLSDRTLSEFLDAKLEAAWQITFSGSNAIPAASQLVVVALVVVAVVALLSWFVLYRPWGWVLMLTGAAVVCGLYVVRIQRYPNFPIPGFFGAWPVALAGLIAIPWLRLKRTEAMTGAALLGFAALVYATQYDIGGAVEWGGRFLAPVVPGLAAVIAAGLVRRWTAPRRPRRAPRQAWAGVGFLVVVLVVPAVAGVAILHRHRDMNRPFHDDVASVATRVVVIDSNEHIHHGFPKLSWRLNESHDFLRTVPGPPAVELIEALFDQGFDAVTVIHAATDPIEQHTPFPRAEDVTPPHTRSIGGAIHILSREGGE